MLALHTANVATKAWNRVISRNVFGLRIGLVGCAIRVSYPEPLLIGPKVIQP